MVTVKWVGEIDGLNLWLEEPHDRAHLVMFTNDGDDFTVQHSMQCRARNKMHECKFFMDIRADENNPRRPRDGRWVVHEVFDQNGLHVEYHVPPPDWKIR